MVAIVALPFLLGAFIIGLICISKSVNLYDSKLIGVKEVFYGFLTSIILYGFTALIYTIQGKAWWLSPFLRLPIIMSIVPYFVYLYFEKNKNSSILIASIAITTIFSLVFYNSFFGIMDHFGISKTH